MSVQSQRGIPRLYGRYPVTVLGDWRIRLPEKLLAQLAVYHVTSMWLSTIPGEKALILCPENEWDEWIDLAKRCFPGLGTLEGKRLYLAPSKPVRPDSKGRITLGDALAEYAALEKGHTALIVGVEKCFEIWSEEEFRKRSANWRDQLEKGKPADGA